MLSMHNRKRTKNTTTEPKQSYKATNFDRFLLGALHSTVPSGDRKTTLKSTVARTLCFGSCVEIPETRCLSEWATTTRETRRLLCSQHTDIECDSAVRKNNHDHTKPNQPRGVWETLQMHNLTSPPPFLSSGLKYFSLNMSLNVRVSVKIEKIFPFCQFCSWQTVINISHIHTTPLEVKNTWPEQEMVHLTLLHALLFQRYGQLVLRKAPRYDPCTLVIFFWKFGQRNGSGLWIVVFAIQTGVVRALGVGGQTMLHARVVFKTFLDTQKQVEFFFWSRRCCSHSSLMLVQSRSTESTHSEGLPRH